MIAVINHCLLSVHICEQKVRSRAGRIDRIDITRSDPIRRHHSHSPHLNTRKISACWPDKYLWLVSVVDTQYPIIDNEAILAVV